MIIKKEKRKKKKRAPDFLTLHSHFTLNSSEIVIFVWEKKLV
jgi:hypothetical protein